MNNELSEEQRNTFNSYQKVYLTDGILQKSEIIENGKIIGTHYVISDRDKIHEVLRYDANASFELHIHVSHFSISEELSFNNRILVRKVIYVSNSDDDVISERRFTLDIDGNELKHHTEKFYYENGEQRYAFEYYQDGRCLIISDHLYDQADIFAEKIGDPTYTNFTWSGFEFYQFADPLFPTEME